MMFAIFRAAASLRDGRGCAPQWIHMLSDSDAPATSCAAMQAELAAAPGESRLDGFPDDMRGNKGPFFSGVPAELRPLAHTAQWMTLALPHALALAADEEGMRARWRPHMLRLVPDWPELGQTNWRWDGVNITRADGSVWRLTGAPDELIPYAELARRGLPGALQATVGTHTRPRCDPAGSQLAPLGTPSCTL
jgi:hypothetical protein